MDLYLIRHADATPLGERGVTEDSERPLSATGEKEAEALGKMLARRKIGIETLVVSPYVRAQQTSMILVRSLKATPEVVTSDALVPNARPRKLAKFLRSLNGERIGLVGHLPHLAVWAGWLIGSKDVQIAFAKAGVAHIVCGELPGKALGTLEWLVTPEWFA